MAWALPRVQAHQAIPIRPGYFQFHFPVTDPLTLSIRNISCTGIVSVIPTDSDLLSIEGYYFGSSSITLHLVEAKSHQLAVAVEYAARPDFAPVPPPVEIRNIFANELTLIQELKVVGEADLTDAIESIRTGERRLRRGAYVHVEPETADLILRVPRKYLKSAQVQVGSVRVGFHPTTKTGILAGLKSCAALLGISL